MHSLSLSHFHVATQNRSCWHCFLLPAYSKPMPLPQTWIWYSLLSHNSPLFKRTSLSLSPLLSILPRNQLSRALSFEEAHSSWQYLFLAPICVHISVLTEYPWYSSQCHQHSGVGSWNTHRPHTAPHLQCGNPDLQETHRSFSLYSNLHALLIYFCWFHIP